MIPLRLRLAALALAPLALACAHHAASAPQNGKGQGEAQSTKFHYRSAAHDLALGDPYVANLDGQSAGSYADAVKYHLGDLGVLTLNTQCGANNGKVAVLVFTSGKKALVQGRAGRPLTTPYVFGDVFVVLRALPGTGPVKVQLVGDFTAAPKNAEPARPPGPDEKTPEPNRDPNELPLDDLLVN